MEPRRIAGDGGALVAPRAALARWASVFAVAILAGLCLACTGAGEASTPVPPTSTLQTGATVPGVSTRTVPPPDPTQAPVTIEPTRSPSEPMRNPLMEQWVGDVDIAVELAASITRSLEDIRTEFASCDFSRAGEFNRRYYEARLELIDAVTGIDRPPGVAEDLTQLLIGVLNLEIQADAVRSTSMQIAIAEGRTSNCDAGDLNETDDAAREAKQLFIEVWNEIAPPYGGRSWNAEDF